MLMDHHEQNEDEKQHKARSCHLLQVLDHSHLQVPPLQVGGMCAPMYVTCDRYRSDELLKKKVDKLLIHVHVHKSAAT